MDSKSIKSVSAQIYSHFPEIDGVKPTIREQVIHHSKSVPTYLLTYQSKVNTSDGKNITRWVRVVANEQGKIIKITTSR